MSAKIHITGNDTHGPISVKGPCSISFSGSFGGGSIAINRKTPTGSVALRDNGTAITITSADDSYYNVGPGTALELVMSGATSPDVRAEIAD